MRIIIAGDGETGTHLAKSLSVEGQDVVLIGSDSEHLAELDAVSNFITYEGSPLSRRALMNCGVDSAQLFVAVTPDGTVNLVACEIAKECGAKRCIARVDNPDLSGDREKEMFRKFGIDLIIRPERLAAREIHRFILHSWVTDWLEIHDGALIMAGVRMLCGGFLCGRPLKEVSTNPRQFHVAAIRRGEKLIIPHGDDVLTEGDTVYFSILPENFNVLPEMTGSRVTQPHRIMISGAGRVTENLLEALHSGYDITVIEPDRERCRAVASRFPTVAVVNSLTNDITTMKEEGIERCDIFLALTGSSETNIVSCMVAREQGVGKTVARIEELQYMPEAESLSIDKIINKKLLNTGKILSLLLDSEVATMQCISLGYIEIAEVVVGEGSEATEKPVAKLHIPRELTVAGLIRDGKGMLVEGRTEIQPGDHAVVFFVPGSLRKVAKFFR